MKLPVLLYHHGIGAPSPALEEDPFHGSAEGFIIAPVAACFGLGLFERPVVFWAAVVPMNRRGIVGHGEILQLR